MKTFIENNESIIWMLAVIPFAAIALFFKGAVDEKVLVLGIQVPLLVIQLTAFALMYIYIWGA